MDNKQVGIFDGIYMEENRESGYESSSSYLNPMHDQSVINSVCHNDEISEAANKRLSETTTTIDSKEKAELAQTLLSLPPLGLSLGASPFFLELKEKLSRRRKTKRAPQADDDQSLLSEKEKIKACSACASFLKIGSWQRVSKHEGDLVVKFYYAKRKLVWEFLENGLKSKIELQWSDIIGIRSVFEENQPAILEIELGHPPLFHRESNPQPRKHTVWNPTTDFTDGEARKYRIHYIQFPHGGLDMPYQKLLQCESWLLELSRRPFPSQMSPFFQSYDESEDISFKFHSNGAEAVSNVLLQFPTGLDYRQLQTYEQRRASLCYGDSSHSTSLVSDEVISNQGVEQQCVPSPWDSQVVAYLLAQDQIPQPLSAAEQQHFNERQMLFEEQLYNHLQIQSNYNNLFDTSIPFPENLNTINGLQQTDYDHERSAETNLIPGRNDHTGHTLPLSYVMPPSQYGWGVPAPQVAPPRHPELHPGENSLRYSRFHPSPTNDDFNSSNNPNRWR